METQEQILKEQRLRIEVLRHQLLLRYYELLLSLDVLAQAAEVKTLMGYINTLEPVSYTHLTLPTSDLV